MLDEKIAGAHDILRRVFARYQRPVVMSSFGKDSMVLLDVVKQAGRKLPLIFHRETAALPKKASLAHRVIEKEGYTVYEYPPKQTAVVKAAGDVDIISFYQIGPSQGADTPLMWMPAGLERVEDGQRWLCALHDFYLRPTGTFEYPWDVTLVGHKSSDTNKWVGDVPLSADIAEIAGGTHLAFPLRHFTDEDVWEYTKRFRVAVNRKRYEDHNLDFDNDHYPACAKCLDRDEAAEVHCPKLGRMVPNISAKVRHEALVKPDYMQ